MRTCRFHSEMVALSASIWMTLRPSSVKGIDFLRISRFQLCVKIVLNKRKIQDCVYLYLPVFVVERSAGIDTLPKPVPLHLLIHTLHLYSWLKGPQYDRNPVQTSASPTSLLICASKDFEASVHRTYGRNGRA